MKRATILTAFVLALLLSGRVYGTSFHGPIGPPDGDGNIQLAHGPIGPPDGDGNFHGPIGPPDGDGNFV